MEKKIWNQNLVDKYNDIIVQLYLVIKNASNVEESNSIEMFSTSDFWEKEII